VCFRAILLAVTGLRADGEMKDRQAKRTACGLHAAADLVIPPRSQHTSCQRRRQQDSWLHGSGSRDRAGKAHLGRSACVSGWLALHELQDVGASTIRCQIDSPSRAIDRSWRSGNRRACQ